VETIKLPDLEALSVPGSNYLASAGTVQEIVKHVWSATGPEEPLQVQTTNYVCLGDLENPRSWTKNTSQQKEATTAIASLILAVGRCSSRHELFRLCFDPVLLSSTLCVCIHISL